MREMISEGNLLTGCNTFHKEGRNFKISWALALRLSIWRVESWPSDPAEITRIDQGLLTSASNEAAEATGGRGDSRNLAHSRPSFSFNTRRRSGMERLRAASKDMVVAVTIQRGVCQ